LAAWKYLGGETESMWLLTDTQLKKQCEEGGLPTSGGREEMLARLAAHGREHENSNNLLTDGSGGGQKRGRGGTVQSSSSGSNRISRASLPENLHSMSYAQLKSVCAAHGIATHATSHPEVIAEIERALYTGSEAEPLLLE